MRFVKNGFIGGNVRPGSDAGTGAELFSEINYTAFGDALRIVQRVRVFRSRGAKRRSTFQRQTTLVTHQRPRIRVDQEFGRVKAMTRCRLKRALCTQTIKLTRFQAGQKTVPYAIGKRRQSHTPGFNLAAFIKQTTVHRCGVARKNSQIHAGLPFISQQACPHRPGLTGQPGRELAGCRHHAADSGSSHSTASGGRFKSTE